MHIVFYQPFHTRCSVSPSFRQRDFHVTSEFVAIAPQVPDLVVHYTIAFVVYHHRSSHSYSTLSMLAIKLPMHLVYQVLMIKNIFVQRCRPLSYTVSRYSTVSEKKSQFVLAHNLAKL